MVTKEEAEKKVLDHLSKFERKPRTTNYAVIIDQYTVELPWGWLFYWNGKEFIEIGDTSKAYVGNVPTMYDKLSNEITPVNSLFAHDFMTSTILKEYALERGYEWDDSMNKIIDK